MKSQKWQWWEILLWAYSTLYMVTLIALLTAGAAAPASEPTTSEESDATVVALVITLAIPVLGFLIQQGTRHIKELSEF